MIIKAHLSSDKYQYMLFIIIDILQRKSISFYIFEKLLDFLSFCYMIISFDRLFLRQIFNLFNRKTHHLAYIQNKQNCQTRSSLMNCTSLSIKRHYSHTFPLMNEIENRTSVIFIFMLNHERSVFSSLVIIRHSSNLPPSFHSS